MYRYYCTMLAGAAESSFAGAPARGRLLIRRLANPIAKMTISIGKSHSAFCQPMAEEAEAVSGADTTSTAGCGAAETADGAEADGACGTAGAAA